MTYECLLSCTQALLFGNSYLLKRTRNYGEARNYQIGIEATGFNNCPQFTQKLTSEIAQHNVIISMEVFKPKQVFSEEKGGYIMLLVMTLYCIWWLLREPFYIQVTEVTFDC